jgi:ElaB/YqjD/DUF883 family membrane-anchored ribosome-binding protein
MASDQQPSSSMDPQDLQGMSSQAGATGTSPYPTSADMQRQGMGTSVGSGVGDGSDVMSRVVRTAHDTIDRLADRAAPHVRRMQEGVSGSSERMSDQMEHWRETGDEWAESVRETVREHPIGALATALVAGMLIARLTR